MHRPHWQRLLTRPWRASQPEKIAGAITRMKPGDAIDRIAADEAVGDELQHLVRVGQPEERNAADELIGQEDALEAAIHNARGRQRPRRRPNGEYPAYHFGSSLKYSCSFCVVSGNIKSSRMSVSEPSQPVI